MSKTNLKNSANLNTIDNLFNSAEKPRSRINAQSHQSHAQMDPSSLPAGFDPSSIGPVFQQSTGFLQKGDLKDILKQHATVEVDNY